MPMVTANCGSLLPQKVCSPYNGWEEIDQLSNDPQETQRKIRYYSYIIDLLCVRIARRRDESSDIIHLQITDIGPRRLIYDRNFRKLTISLIDNIFEISLFLITLRK